MKNEDEKFLSQLIQRYKICRGIENCHAALESLINNTIGFANIKLNVGKDNPLSVMEMLCMTILAIGKNPDRCADLLCISVKTVTTYEKRIRTKLGAGNRTNAFYLAQIRGFISVVPSKCESEKSIIK